MIDIHTHILPGVDDGAADLYDTIEMATLAVESGVKGIVVTPHCNIPGMFDNYYSEEYIELFKKTESVLRAERVPLTLYSGMEVFMTQQVPKLLKEGKLLTINGSKNMLVEFNFGEDPDYVERMLSKVLELGVRPIIAHPERYRFVQENLQLTYRWVRQGCLLQVNRGSLIGRFGRKAEYAAYGLLNHNLVTVVASDAHSPYQRTTYMKDVYEMLLREYPKRYIDTLFIENPERICKDMPVIRFTPRPFEEEE